MHEFNSDKVDKTLRILVDILESNKIKYRFLGSVLVAAINGKLHRNLGDLDLIIDEKDKDIFSDQLKKIGFVPADGIMYDFARKYLFLETLKQKELLEVGYFYGNWKKDGSMVFGNKNINVSIDNNVLHSDKYLLLGVHFFGISKRAVATRVFASRHNPKRKNELSIIKENHIEPSPDNFIHVNIFGINFDWIYHFIQITQNIVGFARIKMGLSFDPWR